MNFPEKLVDFKLLEIRELNVNYSGIQALKNINLTIHQGEVVTLIGANGAGKTTITKLLTGMYDDYDGDIFINDKNLRDYSLAELKAMFAVVYQDFAKYFISAKDNVLIGNTLNIGNIVNEESVNKTTRTRRI